MRKTRLSVAALLGLLVVLVYLATATGLLQDDSQLLRAAVFAIGPVAIVGVLSIAQYLAADKPGLALRTASAFLVSAFALLTLMLVVQQAVFIRYHEFSSATADAATLASLQAAFRLVNEVQLGIDVCFDIFYCTGIIMLSVVMYRHRDFGRLIGIFGALAAAALLALNLVTFPRPPADAGLVDLGPLTGVWWVVVIIQFSRLRRRASSSP